jgi:hypothetical protein
VDGAINMGLAFVDCEFCVVTSPNFPFSNLAFQITNNIVFILMEHHVYTDEIFFLDCSHMDE